VVQQDPPPGALLEPGATATLVLTIVRAAQRAAAGEQRYTNDVVETLRPWIARAASGVHSDAPIGAIAYDSRRVSPGPLSSRLAPEGWHVIYRRGRARHISSRRTGIDQCRGSSSATHVWALALLADRFFNHPSRRMPVIGVTGTNCKTPPRIPLFDPRCSRHASGMLGTVAHGSAARS
jgi:hypothetical protein